MAADAGKIDNNILVVNNDSERKDRAISASVNHLGINDRNARNDFKTGANTPLVKRNQDSSMKLEAVNSVKLIHNKGDYEQDGNNQGHKYYTPAIRNRSPEVVSDSSGSYEERSRSYKQSPNQLNSSPSRNGTNAASNPALQLILKLK